ncbi:hypothetical protein TcWFU_006600 [Taenia crassiceps]|uniref:Uncharacterized protein n=1 Tax=Taenia crassiceps TaxID=6207 RepID=A0ABR4Q2Z3_9CEST
MVMHLWLILLIAFVLPEGSRGQDEGYFMPDVTWYNIGSEGLMMRWNIRQFIYRQIEEVRLTVKQTFDPSYTVTKSASVNSGNIKVYGLKPFTYYTLEGGGYKQGNLIFGVTTYLRTWPTGKFRIHFHCISSPTLSTVLRL